MSNNKQSSNQVPDVRKMVNSVEWFSNQVYELFEQYSEGNFDRITLNKLVLKATEQAKAMHKEEIDQSYRDGFEFALINECAKQSTSDASQYAEGYSEGYKRALELVEWKIQNELKEKK